MVKLMLILGIIGFILLGVGITHILEKNNWLPSRWITGLLVFLIILVPSIIFPQLPNALKLVLYFCSGLLAVVFFETTRGLLERNEYKGIVKTQTKRK
ncbi:hypothetical protein [Candidatus Enterococcus mansonii]|uniref:Uncharacterized protein n=1 Tax=Candidatus Enterococcus mansonii TaxID=1834181 RepID=A0A242C791_9ENTE|nr:hypothetical protein [Enterococcus sp. 4G2_DIV0659]OTO05662.1 hypothetical protein A5880_002837 [Enterococcus sp. 4G2_DIV0659]